MRIRAAAVVGLGFGIVLAVAPSRWPELNDAIGNVGIALMLLGAVAFAITLEPIAVRLPTVTFGGGPGTFRIEFHEPVGAATKRLRDATFALVKEIHSWVRAQPSPGSESIGEHHAMVAEMATVTDEAARQAIWNKYTQRLTGKYENERRDLGQRFGGRVRYVLGEYVQREMISEQEARKVDWQMGSTHWATDATSTLEALARRL